MWAQNKPDRASNFDRVYFVGRGELPQYCLAVFDGSLINDNFEGF